jgi:hypothetical protein
MKHIIVAAAFALLAAPAFAADSDTRAPYEKDRFDRTLPDIQRPALADRAGASAGSTSVPTGAWATGVWADDHNFVVPAE